MKIGIIHTESTYYAGAERVLDYYLQGLVETPVEAVVFYGRGSKVEQFIPAKYRKVALDGVQGFHPVNLWRAAGQIQAVSREEGGFDLLHAWAARGWDLAGLAGWRMGVPVLGTLHDSPGSLYISRWRRVLMRFSAARLLKSYACVSHALILECQRFGYPTSHATVVHNGLPDRPLARMEPADSKVRLGFLGGFLPGKGLDEMFGILDQLWASGCQNWKLSLAGGTSHAESEAFMAGLAGKYSGRGWWKAIEWPGWVVDCHPFLSRIDLLIVPSSGFDSLPTVVLEAYRAGTPVLGSRIGGIPELIEEGKTGWVFDTKASDRGAAILQGLLEDRRSLKRAGEGARQRFAGEFSLRKMVAEYTRLYSTLV